MTQRTNSAAFGHSPCPSPSRERTPQSQRSWQPSTTPLANIQKAQERDPSTSASPTAAYLPQAPSTGHLAAAAPLQYSARGLEPDVAPMREAVRPLMTSSRKRAAVGSLSPQIRPSLAPQEHRVPDTNTGAMGDPIWEAHFQEAVRQAMLALGTPWIPASQTPQIQQPVEATPFSAAALAEAEASYIAQGLRPQEAKGCRSCGQPRQPRRQQNKHTHMRGRMHEWLQNRLAGRQKHPERCRRSSNTSSRH